MSTIHPSISLPRHGSNAGPSGSSSSSSRRTSLQMPRILKRALKFPQMDFELAVWEMTSLLLSPKRVFRNYHYHRQTQRTWHRPDPSFAYLLGLFMLLTSLGWGLAYADGLGRTLKVALVFVLGHFLAASLVVATAAYFLVGRFLGPGVKGLPTFGRRQRGLFQQPGADGEQLEFGYCFDVAIRAFFPVWVFLYVVQFVLMPVIAKGYWVSLFLGNTLYLLAFGYYTIITFLGYNALPFLQHTELLLAPTAILAFLYVASLFGFNMPRHFAPILWAAAGLGKGV